MSPLEPSQQTGDRSSNGQHINGRSVDKSVNKVSVPLLLLTAKLA